MVVTVQKFHCVHLYCWQSLSDEATIFHETGLVSMLLLLPVLHRMLVHRSQRAEAAITPGTAKLQGTATEHVGSADSHKVCMTRVLFAPNLPESLTLSSVPFPLRHNSAGSDPLPIV